MESGAPKGPIPVGDAVRDGGSGDANQGGEVAVGMRQHQRLESSRHRSPTRRQSRYCRSP